MEEFAAEPPTNPGDSESYPGGNSTGNNTGNSTDTSAYLGPIEMKGFVQTFYNIIIPLVIGAMVVLAILEGVAILNRRRMKRKGTLDAQGKGDETT
jgi:hypothetical protein